MERLSHKRILQNLDQFLQLCTLIGLRNGKERFTQYRGTIVHLMSAIKTHPLSEQALIALMEAAEVSLLLPYLQQCNRDDIFPKLKECLGGPFMPNDENPKSNQARNIQFELFLASTLWRAGFQPVLGLHPDLKCRVGNKWLFIECKRLFSSSPRALRDNIGKAATQLQENRRNASPGTRGLIAISLSRILNPSQAARQSPNEQQGRKELAAWLRNKAEEVRDAWEPLSHKKILILSDFVVHSL